MASAKAQVLPYVNAGPTKVTVSIHNGQKALPLLQHGAKLYVVAVPDEEFQIHVARQDMGLHQPGIIVQIKVDGESIGYCRYMVDDSCPTTTFSDYLGAPGAATDELTKFKFQPVAPAGQAQAIVVDNPDEIKAGRIHVLVRALGNPIAAQANNHNPVRAQQPPVVLPDGKKFFMAPSLTCGEGARAGQIKWSTTRYNTLHELGSVELRYETVATLMLRKVLDPTCPEHKRIIDEFGLQAAAGPAPSTAAAGHAQHGGSKKRARAAAADGGAKGSCGESSRPRKAGKAKGSTAVKPEPGTVASPAAANGPAVVVDLTGEVPPLRVNGKELRKDQFAVCDLTSDASARPAGWQVVDKIKEEVALD